MLVEQTNFCAVNEGGPLVINEYRDFIAGTAASFVMSKLYVSFLGVD